MCVYYMTGTPEGSTESGFMEKPGIEPATPGLQGIALTHYTTGASQMVDLSYEPPSLSYLVELYIWYIRRENVQRKRWFKYK